MAAQTFHPQASPAGQPHVEVGVGNAKLALALAAILLAAGKTVSVKRKEVRAACAAHTCDAADGVSSCWEQVPTRLSCAASSAPFTVAVQVGSLAVHFPITANGVKYDHSLQERVRPEGGSIGS